MSNSFVTTGDLIAATLQELTESNANADAGHVLWLHPPQHVAGDKPERFGLFTRIDKGDVTSNLHGPRNTLRAQAEYRFRQGYTFCVAAVVIRVGSRWLLLRQPWSEAEFMALGFCELLVQPCAVLR